MYAINLDFDPTTVGFDPHEVTKNGNGTYTVTRRFVHAEHYFSNANTDYSIEAYCPCLTDNVEIYCYEMVDYRGRTTYGANYVTNGGERCTNDRRSMNNSMTDFWHPIGSGMFNRKYDTHMEEGSDNERACSFCVSKVNGHPNNITSSLRKDYFEKHHIVFGKSAPTSPEEDPFLPEAFKKMLGGQG